MTEDNISNNKEKYNIESVAVLKSIGNEAQRRPDLLAALIMTWLDEDAKVINKGTHR